MMDIGKNSLSLIIHFIIELSKKTETPSLSQKYGKLMYEKTLERKLFMANIEGSITEATIESEQLQCTISLSVYLPANYTPLKSYRLMICQDGQDFFRFGRVHRQVDSLIDDLDIEELIVVGVPYPSVAMRHTWYHPNNETHVAYTRFLACELLPYLEKKLQCRTIGRSTYVGGRFIGSNDFLANCFRISYII